MARLLLQIVLLLSCFCSLSYTSSNHSSSYCHNQYTVYEAISQTLNRYAFAIDSKNFARLDQVFAEDIVADYGVVGVFRSRKPLKRAIQNTLVTVTSQHSLTTKDIDIHESTAGGLPISADSTTYFVGTLFGTGKYEGEVLYAYGKYVDQLVTVNVKDDCPQWRINRRHVILMGPFIGNASILNA